MNYELSTTKQGAVLETTSDLVARLMMYFNIPLSHVVSHEEVANGKTANGTPLPLTASSYPGEKHDPGIINMEVVKANVRLNKEMIKRHSELLNN